MPASSRVATAESAITRSFRTATPASNPRTLTSALSAQLVALVRPGRDEVWVARSPEEERSRLEALLRDAFMRVRLESLDNYHWHAVDAEMEMASGEDINGLSVLSSSPAAEGDRLVLVSLTRRRLLYASTLLLSTVENRSQD